MSSGELDWRAIMVSSTLYHSSTVVDSVSKTIVVPISADSFIPGVGGVKS